MVVVAILFVAAAVIVLRSLKRLPAGEYRVVERMGRRFKVIGPGVNLVAPLVDAVREKIDIGEQEVELNVRGYDTADGKHAAARCFIRFHISDPQAFLMTSLLAPPDQARVLANQAFADVIGQRPLAVILADTGAAGDAALAELDPAMARCGMQLLKFDVVHIEESAAVPEDEDDLELE